MTDYVPQELVNAFVLSSGRHFQMLAQTYGLQRSLKTEVLGSRGMQPVRPEDIGNRFFMLKLSLKGVRFSIDIFYGDREHDVACLISNKDFKEAYALWEWLEILGRRELLTDSGGWVLTEGRIESVLAQLADVLGQLAPAVANASSTLEKQMQFRRRERMRLDQEQLAEEEHRRLACKAAEAFRRQDYAAVIDALSAVKVELSASEQAKLAYAQKKLMK